MLQNDLRLILVKDSKALADLHAHCFRLSWGQEEFESLLMYGAFGWRHEYGFLLLRMHEILTFCVHPSYQRQGIGEKLLQCALKNIEPPLYLEVAIHNTPAIRLYQSYGFSCLTHRLHYYGQDQHALSLGYLT